MNTRVAWLVVSGTSVSAGREMVMDGFKEWEFISYTSHSFWSMYSMSYV